MTSRIKPPDSPGAVSGPEEAQTDAVDAATFAREVEGAAPTDPAAPAEGTHPALEALRADLESGQVTVEQALDRLVERAMATASGLPEAQQEALRTQLRAALAEDPALSALTDDLRRAAQGG